MMLARANIRGCHGSNDVTNDISRILIGMWDMWNILAEALIGALRRMDGWIKLILVVISRSVDDLHNGISGVVIGDQKWQILRR